MSPATKEPSYAALRRHNKRIQAMIDDPECVGELLAFGTAVARYVDLDPKWKTPGPERRKTYAMFGRETLERIDARRNAVRYLLRNDIRRYDPMIGIPNVIVCGAPMIRRDGKCGKSTGQRGMVTDLDTGHRTMVGACSNPRHREWFDSLMRRNWAAQKEHPAAIPAANTGGVLRRHIPEINWDKVYADIDPKWTPPPEDEPWQLPRLSLLLGDADLADPEADRPALVIVQGAGELVNIDSPRQP